MQIILMSAALVVSLIVNAILFYTRLRARKQPMAQDARQLLADLTKGGAIVRVEVIDPEGLMVYRSVR